MNAGKRLTALESTRAIGDASRLSEALALGLERVSKILDRHARQVPKDNRELLSGIRPRMSDLGFSARRLARLMKIVERATWHEKQ